MELLPAIFSMVLLLQVGPIENKKILSLLPQHTKSHFFMFESLFEALASKGHEIDLFTPLDYIPKAQGINVTKTEYPDIHTIYKTSTMAEIRKMTTYEHVNVIFGVNFNICHEAFKQDVFKKIRDTKTKYDLLILEIFAMDCLFGYANVLKTPVVAMTSSMDLPWGTNRVGNPDNPSYIVNYFRGSVPEMTIYETIMNTLSLIQYKIQHNRFLRQQEVEAKRMFGDDLPPLNDIIANTSLFIVNSHFSMNHARPNVPNVIEAGGLHIKEPKPLTESFSSFIGNSKFIYFSLGSLAKIELIPIEILQNFCDIFRELKYKVLWKTDKSKLPKDLRVPDNVYATAWMPQFDILCQPNIVLFITHNGLMSTQEAVYCGVPMMSVPVFADQFHNAKAVERSGLGREIEIETISKQELYEIMKELIEEPRYKQNAQKISSQFKDRPRKPIDEAIYWIEYVLRHNGAPQLRSRAAHLAWYQYYLLDVGLIIVSCLVFIISVVYLGIRSILKRSKQSAKQKQS